MLSYCLRNHLRELVEFYVLYCVSLSMAFIQEYQQELFQLKEEFERYKTRAQSVLKNRGNKVKILEYCYNRALSFLCFFVCVRSVHIHLQVS